MRIEFDDEEYPELSRYLSDPKRKMRFLYFLEEIFTENAFDPMLDGLKVKDRRVPAKEQAGIDVYGAIQGVYPCLDNIANALSALSKNMEGSVIGRFPTEHVVHEVAENTPEKKPRKTNELDETDYSSTEGIDFGPAIAMFED